MFKKILLLLLLTAAPALAQIGPIQGHSFLGGTQAKTQGLTSSNYLNGIIPHATISVYYTGTTTLVPGSQIFSNSTGTVLGNPFTSNNVTSVNPGGYLFFISLSVPVDVVGSGGISPNTYPVPVPLCVYCFASQAGGGGGSGCTTDCVITDPSTSNRPPNGDQTIVQPSGSMFTLQDSALNGQTFTPTGAAGCGIDSLIGCPEFYTQLSQDGSFTDADYNCAFDFQFFGQDIRCNDTEDNYQIDYAFEGDTFTVDGGNFDGHSGGAMNYDPQDGFQFVSMPGFQVSTLDNFGLILAAGNSGVGILPYIEYGQATDLTSGSVMAWGCFDCAQHAVSNVSGGAVTLPPLSSAPNDSIARGIYQFFFVQTTGSTTTLGAAAGDTINLTGTTFELTAEGQAVELIGDSFSQNWSVLGVGSGSGGSGSVGTAGQLQMVGSTAGSFAASAATDNGSIFSIGQVQIPDTLCPGCAGAIALQQGTAPGSLPANNIQIFAPTSVTAYGIELPGVQPSGSSTFLSCTAANPAICSWAAGGGGSGGYTNLTGSISETTVSAINSACGSGTYYATTPLSIATGGTVSCPVQFSKSGLWTIASGQTVTFTYPITETDAPTQHFAGSGVVALAGQNAPVEWWGAVADWNWGTSTGTDNHVPIQACLNDLAAGNCLLSAGGYSVGSTTITITRNSIGLKGINHGSYSSNLGTTWTDATAPYASQLISTSASADVIDVGGTSNGAVIQWTTVESIGIERSVTPSGTAAGLSCKFDVGGIFRDLDSDDSIYDYYIEQCSGHETYGFINANARWGQNGVTVTGSVYGFYINAAASPNQLNSLNLINVAADNKGTGASGDTAYGIYETGGILSDLFVDGYAGVNGLKTPIYIDGTSATTAIDMFFSNLVLDAPKAGPCIYLNMSGVSLSTFPTQSFVNVKCQGGSGTIPYAVDIENAGSVQFSNLSILQISPTTAALYVHDTNSFTMTGSTIAPSSAVPAEILDHSSYSPQTGNNFISGNSGTTNIVSVLSGTTNSLIGNVFSGIATCGYTLDASSTHNHYANQNSFESVGGSITTAICDSGTDNQSSAGTTTNALTMNNSGSGASSGDTFNGSAAKTISYNTIGAAPLASPTFTGTPAAPTASGGTNTTQLATTAFVESAIAAASTGAGIVTYSGPSLTFTGTLFFPIGGGAVSSTTETNVDIPSPAAATVQNFSVQMSAAPGVGNSVAYTWRKNAASTALTCTISGASATSCNDLTHTLTVAQGDLMDVQAVTTGTIVGTPTVIMGTQFGIAASGSGITQLTGDGTAGPGSGSQALTLATVNSNTGSCGDSTHVCEVTLNEKGLATAATPVAISGGSGAMTNITNSVVFTGCTVTGNVCTPTGSVSSIDIASIPSTGNHLEIIMTGTGNFGNTHWLVNGDTGADYGSQYVQGAASTASAGQVTITTAASCFGVNAPFTGVDMKVPFYSVASPYQVLNSETRQLGGALTTGTMFTNDSGCFWKAPSPAAINEIKLVPTSNFDTSVHVTVYLIQ